MVSPILPLRMIAFQSLFLLITISIEAFVLHRELKLSNQKSIQYAASINLLSTVMGWIIFFIVEPFIPRELKEQLMNYIFFDQFFSNIWSGSLTALVIVTGFLTFFLSFIVKVQGLDLLQLLLQDRVTVNEPELDRANKYQMARRAVKDQRIPRGEATAILHANAASYSAIVLILLLRLFIQST